MLSHRLPYIPPYAWAEMLAFLAKRTVAGVEAVQEGAYLRTVEMEECRGWVRVADDSVDAALRVEVSPSLAPVLPELLARLRHLFDLSAAPAAITSVLGPLAAAHPGLRVPGAFDGFEIAVRAVLGQQITVAAATTLSRRFAEAFGEPLATPHPGLDRLTPRPERIAAATHDDIGRLGIIRTRSKAILELAHAVRSGQLVLAPGADPAATMAQLRALPGIGDWTAQYIAMRALAWPDAFPAGDIALQKAAGGLTARQLTARAEAWRPWRAYAVMHLWLGKVQDPRAQEPNRPR